jgi:predicted HTH transcriptional regulator
MLDCTTLLEIIANGEDSFHQFKAGFDSIDKLAVEISAFANSDGGMLVVGVTDEGNIKGLERDDIRRLNQWIAHATSQSIEPPVFVKTEIVNCDESKVLVIHVPRGANKPYSFKKSEFWVKTGADKRRATREELLRLMQASHTLYADEMSTDLLIEELDNEYFARFYRTYYDEALEDAGIPLSRLLENSKLARGGYLTLAGVLVFGKFVGLKKPQFGIKATYYETEDRFRDKEDIGGKLIDQFKKGVDFIERNLHRIQPNDDFNAPGMIEIPVPVIKEVIANALVHRDYFISSSIFINMYNDRVDVISPGGLPNTVTIDNIKYGIHIERNPIILSYMAKEQNFGYTGRGSGIPKILRICKENHIQIAFENDTTTNRFKVTIQRRTGNAG